MEEARCISAPLTAVNASRPVPPAPRPVRTPCASTGVVGTGVPPKGSAVTMRRVMVGSTRKGTSCGDWPNTPRDTTLPEASAHS